MVAHHGAVVVIREQWWLIRELWWLIRELWWLTREQWWLIGIDKNCETAVLGSNPAISPAYSGLPDLRWAASGMALPYRLSSEGQQRRI